MLEGVRSWSPFSLVISLCNLVFWLSSIISSRDELYLVSSLLIDHGNESLFWGVLFYILLSLPWTMLVFVEYRVENNLEICPE
jgi:hypothetical protein